MPTPSSSEQRLWLKIVYNVPETVKQVLEGMSIEDIIGIYLCSPWFTEVPSLSRILRRKAKAATLFEVLSRWPTSKEHAEMLTSLKQSGAKIRTNPNLHAKLYILDGYTASFAIFGSANLTRQAWGRSLELGILVRDRPFIDKLKRVFWYHLKPLCRKSW